MSTPTYPSDDFKRGSDLLASLGTFWLYYFEDANVLQSHLRHQGWEHGQTYLDFLETVASISRFTVPVFHTDNWYLLTLKRSQMNARQWKYGDGQVFGAQPGGDILKFGNSAPTTFYEFPLPDQMKTANFQILNRIIYPSLTWVNGVEYEIDLDASVIRFLKDPFETGLIALRTIHDAAGAQTDIEAGLWVFRGQFDLGHIYEQFGYVMGMKMDSSEYYRDLINAYWNMFVAGPSVDAVEMFLSAATGIPIIREVSEVVKVIRDEPSVKLVITDRHVYRFPAASNVIVAVGDTVYAGDSLVDAVRIIELAGNREIPDVPAMALGPSFLDGGYYGELTFENKTVSIDWQGYDSDGRAFVTFEVSGFPGDVEKFWNDAQERGKQEGMQTLAEMLDTRGNKTGEPKASDLPMSVNPLEFVLKNLFCNNMFIIRLKLSGVSLPRLGFLDYLRNVVPPHTTYMIFVEVNPEVEYIGLSTEGTDVLAGVMDSSQWFKGVNVGVETIYEYDEVPGDDAAYQDFSVELRAVSLTCK